MVLVSDCITDALSRINAVYADETPSAADMTKGFNCLNTLMDGYRLENLTIPFVQRTIWTITSGTSLYLVGSGQVVNIVPPTSVQQINFIDTSTGPPVLELPMDILTPDAYAAIPQKTLTNNYPLAAFWQPGLTTGSITLWPVPLSSTLQGVLYSLAALPDFTGQLQTLAVPAGYQRFLTLQLAVELCPVFQKQPSPDLVRQAAQAKRSVKAMNYRMRDLSVDLALLTYPADYWTATRFLTGP